MPKRKSRVSIVILTWNACQMTKEQLGDVAKLDTKGLAAETLVVDNGSTDKPKRNFQNIDFQSRATVFF